MVGGSTKVFGLFGDPVAQSLSPLMQNLAFQELFLDCCYLPFLVAENRLADAINAISALGLGGVNLTIPHKERVLSYLDEVDEQARRIRAVNTIVNREGTLWGYNTDAPGFIASLESTGFKPRGKKAVLMGAGGAARAVAFGLAEEGISKLHIYCRNIDSGGLLAKDLQVYYPGLLITIEGDGASTSRALTEADLLINATPEGMYPCHQEEPICTRKQLHPGLLVSDLVYNPSRTRLLKEAAAAGCETLDGLGMLVHQGALAFELWTGEKAPVDLMYNAVSNALRKL